MLECETFGFAIGRPVSEVYEFLLEPTNFSKWAFVGDAPMRHVEGRRWAVETSVGSRIIRFAVRNSYGVLDHEIFRDEGDAPHPSGLWAVANGAGTELVYSNFRRPDMDEAAWTSLKSWMVTDLLALQSLLEAAGSPQPTFDAKLVSYGINRPVAAVYDFLATPENFAKWAFAGDASMAPAGEGEWAVETSVGPRVIRFSPRNGFGVLNYWSRLGPGAPPHPIPMRVLANGGGTELIYVFYRRPEMSAQEWASLIEWVSADLLALKSSLEAG